VLLAARREDVLSALDLAPEARRALARAARARVLAGHTYAHRAARLESLVAALGVPTAARSSGTRR
jgi:spore maturation protein CgeB